MTAVQVMRTLDKFDRVGVDGLRSLLGDGLRDNSGAFLSGCGLDPVQIELLVAFMGTRRVGNGETLEAMHAWASRASRVRSRIELMVAMEGTALEGGETLWDCLVKMRPNTDETWNDGGRPQNIAIALDDMANALDGRRTHAPA